MNRATSGSVHHRHVSWLCLDHDYTPISSIDHCVDAGCDNFIRTVIVYIDKYNVWKSLKLKLLTQVLRSTHSTDYRHIIQPPTPRSCKRTQLTALDPLLPDPCEAESLPFNHRRRSNQTQMARRLWCRCDYQTSALKWFQFTFEVRHRLEKSRQFSVYTTLGRSTDQYGAEMEGIVTDRGMRKI